VICHGRAAQTNLLQTALKPLATQCALRFYQKSSVNNRRKSAEANPSLTSLSSPRQTQHAIFLVMRHGYLAFAKSKERIKRLDWLVQFLSRAGSPAPVL
jgi:hypothetical protein